MKELTIMELFPFAEWAGPARHVYDLTKSIKQEGHDICVVTREWDGAEPFQELCDVYQLPLKHPERIGIRHVPFLVKIIKERNIDIIHTHGGLNSWTALFATMCAGRGKVVNTWHGLRGLKDDVTHRWFYEKIGAIISVSDMLKKRITDSYYYIDSKKIHVVHNGIDMEKFSGAATIDVRKKLNIPENAFVAGVFGRLHPEKGIEYAVQAMALLKERPEVYLLLIGDGNDDGYKSQLKAIVDTHKLHNRVIFCGFTPDVPSYMKAVNILIMPSICQESCPLVLGEAMAASKAIITTGLGAQGEIVEDGVNGYIIPANSEKAIAEKVVKLAEDRELCQNFGAKGRRIAEKKFSMQVMGRKTVEVFFSCLQ